MTKTILNQSLLLFAIISAGFIIFNMKTSPSIDEFAEWKELHQINYEGEFENSYRRRIFFENKAKIMIHNSDPSKTYSMGLNQFSAMTDEELKQQLLSNNFDSELNYIEVEVSKKIKAGDIDWTQQGAVPVVRNQGQCAAAWVFSTTGPLQGLSKIADGKLQILSDQQLIDCANPSGSGCTGGYPGAGFKYVKEHGICTEAQYPYKGVPQTCKRADGSFKILGYTEIKSSCNDLSVSIHKGPVSVLVDASNWFMYSSGVFSNCGTSLNHAVTLVGQIQDNWKVQNSWGTSWGQKGYMRLAKGNTCGICTSGIIPYK